MGQSSAPLFCPPFVSSALLFELFAFRVRCFVDEWGNWNSVREQIDENRKKNHWGGDSCIFSIIKSLLKDEKLPQKVKKY